MSRESITISQKFVYKLIEYLFTMIPFQFFISLGDLTGYILYYLLKKRRRTGLSNLYIAFPEKSEKELLDILKRSFQNISKDLLEILKYYVSPAEVFKKRITIIGKENLDQSIISGKGVVILSAHFGNFPVLCGRLAIEGYQVAVIFREIHNNFFRPFMSIIQEERGLTPIKDKPRHRCVGMSIKSLKKRGLLFLQIDQNPSKKAGIIIDFFGRKIPTFRGPVSLAMRTGADIIPIFIMRKPNNHHQIIIKKPYKMKLTENKERDIRDNLQALSKITEDYIRQNPSYWWWIHRRFRKAID